MYYVNYNDIDLTDRIKVKKVETTLTPPRENSTISIWERAGSIYNDYRWDDRKIKLTFLLLYSESEYNKNQLVLDQGLADIRSCFNVDSPKPLYLGDENKFIHAIPDGEIDVNMLSNYCAEIEVEFMCYDPFYYSEEAKKYDGTSFITTYNSGDVPTDPIIEIGINEDCHFVQLENLANHKKMLIGNFPVVSKPSVSENSNVIVDECDSLANWTTGTTSVDSDRTRGGRLAMTSNGQGIMCGEFGSSNDSTTWHGVSARRNLGTNIKNFQVEAFITNTSTGVNGDPNVSVDMTDPETKYSVQKGYEDVQVTEGGREEYYEVICTSLWKRTGPSTSYPTSGYWKKGDKIYPKNFTGHKGLWGEVEPGKWSYCSPSYVQKKVVDTTTVKTIQKETTTTVTRYVKNFFVNSTANVRQEAKKDSKLICTVSSGEIVRLVDEKLYEDNDTYWYKLENAYNGNWGYIEGSKVTPANNVSIEYPVEPETADDKTGVIELYGYDVNGSQLFKLSLVDDNEWYEFNYPLATIGAKEFIKDNSVAPSPKIQSENKVSSDKLTVTKDYLLSGRYGDWNDFFGKVGIKRENDTWQVWFIKMEGGNVVKQVWSSYQKVSGAPTGNLSYITLYIGTSGDKPTGMSLERLEVKNLTPADPQTNNIKKFQKGDVLKIDCYNNRVWLNDKIYNNIEIGSQFFPLEVGENTIKITSDKSTTNTVIFNEKYL